MASLSSGCPVPCLLCTIHTYGWMDVGYVVMYSLVRVYKVPGLQSPWTCCSIPREAVGDLWSRALVPKERAKQDGAMERKGFLHGQGRDFSGRSGLACLVSCKSAVAMPSVKAVSTRDATPALGCFFFFFPPQLSSRSMQ